MRVLAISNNKGGVGKTTLTLHLGCALARRGSKVLVVDADPQATLTRALLGDEPQEGLTQLILDDYGTGTLVDDLLKPTAEPNLSILPAGVGLEGGFAQLTGLAVNRVRDAIDDLKTPTDIVLIDAPPRLGAAAEAVLLAADSVLYPIDGGSESLVALQKLGRSVARVQKHRPAFKVLGVVVTRAQDNATHRLVGQTLAQLYADYPVRGAIPESAFVLQASARRATVFDLAQKNQRAQACAQAYVDIAAQVATELRL